MQWFRQEEYCLPDYMDIKLDPMPDNLVDIAPWRLTATDAVHRIRDGRLTAEELLRSCLARITEREPVLRAWNHLDAEGALCAARETDKGMRRGALCGLPLGVKDMIDVGGMPTTHNSPIYQGAIASRDAASVSIARAEGALVVGKTDTVEFAAAGRRALTRNPWHGEYSPGGSSSGSAAAVGEGMVPLAIGTQTGGSTIRPASFCGVYAMKPTHGLVNREGAKQYSYTLDTIGWYGRCIADLRLMADAFRLPAQPPLSERRPLRIALCRTPYWDKATEAAREALSTAAVRLTASGAEVVELELPEIFAGLNQAQRAIMLGEGRTSFLPEYLHHFSALHQDFRDRVENSEGLTPDAMRAAYDLAATCRREFDPLAARFDAILTPAAPGEAPRDLKDSGNAIFNAFWTLLHVPCIAIPCIRGPQGLPVGVQIIGPRFSDMALLAVAEDVAAAIDDGARPPSW
jgi:Asp-tRNA(Asn)/Glu-tRNA(Gln) amidotransferase A subunit family amidase